MNENTRNFDLMANIIEPLRLEDQHTFAHYVLGYVARHVPEDVWMTAMNNAIELLKTEVELRKRALNRQETNR